MYERILIPTDGSPGVDRAVDEGIRVASLCDATVHALYVVDTSAYSTLPEAKWLSLRDDLDALGAEAVDEVAERAERAGVRVETTIARGVPHRAILDYADDADVDLIVMGTHGRTGVGRFLLGSVTERVARVSAVPVLVVGIDRPTDDADPDADRR